MGRLLQPRRSRNRVTNPNNTDNGKYLASLDAVPGPDGTVVCWVSTQPQFASLYPGCVPTNITDPSGPSPASFNYLRQATSWTLTQELDDVSGSIGGDLGFGLPAGNIKSDLSGDARWATYDMDSDAPADRVRQLHRPAHVPGQWRRAGALGAEHQCAVEANNNVYEFALEVNIPLLADMPVFQDCLVNLAGRYTKYSTFDAGRFVEDRSQVAGRRLGALPRHLFVGHPRAEPQRPVPAGRCLFDGLQGPADGRQQQPAADHARQPELTPEEARTVTPGLVFTPASSPLQLRGRLLRTKLTNAITQISYQNDAIQNLCLASAPQYNSPFCTLAIRPITDVNDPNYDQPVNAPTAIRNAPANSSVVKTSGFDFQIDYNVDLWGGQFSFRHLANYQPTNSTLPTPASSFYTWAVQPHLMQTTFLTYQKNGWTGSLQNRWLSNVSLKTSDNSLNPANNQHYVDSSLDAYDVVDITIGKEFEFGESAVDAYLTVNNLLDESAPLYGSNSGLPGLFYPTLGFYDDMGRYFTVGARMRF